MPPFTNSFQAQKKNRNRQPITIVLGVLAHNGLILVAKQASPPPHFLKSSAGLEENYYAALRRHSFRKRLLLRYTMASFQSSSAKIGQARPPAGGRAGGRGGLWHRPASSRSGRVATGACQLRLATVLHVLGLQRASKQQQPLRRDLILCSFNGLFLSRPDIYENTYLYYNYVFLCLLYSLFTFR